MKNRTVYTIERTFPVTTPAVAIFEQQDGSEFCVQVVEWAVISERTFVAATGQEVLNVALTSRVEGIIKTHYGERDDPWHFEIADNDTNFLGYRDGIAHSSGMLLEEGQ